MLLDDEERQNDTILEHFKALSHQIEIHEVSQTNYMTQLWTGASVTLFRLLTVLSFSFPRCVSIVAMCRTFIFIPMSAIFFYFSRVHWVLQKQTVAICTPLAK